MTGLAELRVSPLTHRAGRPLVDQITDFVRSRVDECVLRAGMRMPSIRRFAEDNGVSRFTAVEAYDRLVAQGYLESRRGSGFYVRARAQTVRAAPAPEDPPGAPIDLAWLLRSMFTESPDGVMAGSGVLPGEWLDEDMINRGMRALARGKHSGALAYGSPEGYLPLRQQIQLLLAGSEIDAAADQIVLTAGASQALDLVARRFLSPGDTVIVDDPGYYVMFGRLAAMGIKMAGVPRRPDGPDIARLEQLAAELRPRLYITQSMLHNPTGTTLSPASAHRILQLAERLDFRVLEDDVFGDLLPGKGQRIAALDQLKRVIYVGSFSKTLGAGLRVGFVACERTLARELTDQKMLASLTTPELGERLVHQMLADGHYRKHLERLRERLARAIDRSVANLERVGLSVFHRPAGGLFVWARGPEKLDSNALAYRSIGEGVILAPGSLFSPSQLASPWMRFSVATANHPRVLRFLESALR